MFLVDCNVIHFSHKSGTKTLGFIHEGWAEYFFVCKLIINQFLLKICHCLDHLWNNGFNNDLDNKIVIMDEARCGIKSGPSVSFTINDLQYLNIITFIIKQQYVYVFVLFVCSGI